MATKKKSGNGERVLILGDTHCPCMRPGYIEFLKDIEEAWGTTRTVHIGDLSDMAALSFHTKHPTLKNVLGEWEEAREQIAELTAAFPNVDLLTGNHCALPARVALEAGIPPEFLRSQKDLFDLPDGWTVYPRYYKLEIDNCLYFHGDSGKSTSINNAKDHFMSCINGHRHAQAGVTYYANKHARVFGMQVGCGVDDTRLALDYGQRYNAKSILGCGVVIEGETAVFEPWRI